MIHLDFRITSATAVPFAAVPQLAFRLAVEAPPDHVVHTIVLRCQIQIDAVRRRYTPAEQARLVDLFGEPERWSRTVHRLPWTLVTAIVPRFSGAAEVDVIVPCTFDFNVAATKYFGGLDAGEVPLLFLFSGTVFHETGGTIQAAPVPWDREAAFRLPIETWRAMMDATYPNTAWLCLRRDVFQHLFDFKSRNGDPTWEQAVLRALATAANKEIASL